MRGTDDRRCLLKVDPPHHHLDDLLRERLSLLVAEYAKRWCKLKGDATVRLANGSLRRGSVSWIDVMRVQQSAGSFALCGEDGGMEDLEVRKVYQVLPDRAAGREGWTR